jgi:tRNA(His) guanylyltransferase
VSSQKNEILYSRFEMNYNQLDARYRKGSVIIRGEVCYFYDNHRDLTECYVQTSEVEPEPTPDGEEEQTSETIAVAASTPRDGKKAEKKKKKVKLPLRIDVLHCDIIKDEFWKAHPHLLAD